MSADRLSPNVAQMQALHDVVQAGYARYIGMSSCHAYQCTSAFFPSLSTSVADRPPRSPRDAE